tara:strand:+ start:633 stop:1091 length:459 start_codon:yes stop_codon:yes gene_type:complete
MYSTVARLNTHQKLHFYYEDETNNLHVNLKGDTPIWSQYLDFYRRVRDGKVYYLDVPAFVIQYIVSLSGGVLSGELPPMQDMIKDVDESICNSFLFSEVQNTFDVDVNDFKYSYFTNLNRFMIELHNFTWQKDVFCHREGICNTIGAFDNFP